MIIPFAEWLPDLPIFKNPGATVAKNVIPEGTGYKPFPSLSTYTQSIGGVCKGAVVARDTSGNYYNFAADTSALYKATQLSWSNVSRTVGGAYALPSEDFWEFAQFGNTLIAVNGAGGDVPQAITLGATNFAALGGAPPPAKHIAAIRDFVVLGNISATAVSPQMVRWCAINNPTSWTPDAATMADFQDLPGDGGWVQRIVGGEYGTVFQERAIYRMTFVGSPLIFQFDKIHTNIGAFAPLSVVSYRNFSFFLSEDGFYMFDGTLVTPIGAGKIDTTFFNDLDISNVWRVQGMIDAKRKIVLWAYPGPGNVGGNPNRILIYSWLYKRWSRIEDVNVELLCQYVTGTYTLDGLDSISSSIDALVYSLDSSQWRTGNLLIAAFDSSHRLALFNGSAMPAVVETAEVQPNNATSEGMTYLTQMRPIIEGNSASVTMAVATRNVLTQSATYSINTSINSAGYAECRVTSRFMRFRLATSNATNFDHIQGVDIPPIADGER